MSVTIHRVNNVSAETKTAISRKSAQTLPNNPSERGYSAEEIKRRFYQPILDAANSAIAEIDRVVNEANAAFEDVKDEIDNFIDETSIKEAYKLNLDSETWEYNDETDLYEVLITQETHGIEDYKEIGVDMFLLDGEGNYTHVNQFEVKTNGDVRCFHETNGAGYVSIYVKREGFIVGTAITDINHVIGASKVAKTNNYNDLDNKPDLGGIVENASMISRIISGSQSVGKANAADSATNATYAETAGAADSANTANSSTRATQDQYGVNISNSYSKQNGNYQSMTVGRATNADKATNDANGVNIANNYAKQNGTYANMTVGKATNADNATNATNADKATKDANGANISSTYAKQTGTYANMTVGNANNAQNAGALEGYLLTNDALDIENATANKIASAAAIKQFMEDYYMKVVTGTVTQKSSNVGNLKYSYLAKQGNKVELTVYFDGTGQYSINVGENQIFSVQLSSGFYNTSRTIVCQSKLYNSNYYATISTAGVLTFYIRRMSNTSSQAVTGGSHTFEYLIS